MANYPYRLGPSSKYFHNVFVLKGKRKGKGKAVPLQAWSGPEGSG